MTGRVLVECRWSPDGAAVFHLRPGEVVSDNDPRLAGGFFTVAQREGWVEVTGRPKSSPARSRRSPGKARKSPARSKRTAPERKDAE